MRCASAVSLRVPARLALVLLGSASLAACASVGPHPRMAGPVGSSTPPPPSAFIDRSTGKPLTGTMKPYQVRGLWYYPQAQPDYDVTGLGSWYGEQFHNRQTANGESFDMDVVSAAHKTLPLPSLVEVTNLDNGRKMTVRVNDRGPFVDDRLIDLSRAGAEALGFRQQGLAHVRVRYLGPAPAAGAPRQQVAASMAPPAVSAPFSIVEPLNPERLAPPRRVPAATTGFRVQAGAFSSRDNAVRAAAQVANAGAAVIEPVGRGETVLYRVVLGPAADEAMAWALRDQVAALGFRDASILRP